MCILSNSIARGPMAGIKVCCGIACAALVHVTAATLGLTAFLSAVSTAFLVVKAIGAAYLVWLGWQMLRRPVVMGVEMLVRYWSCRTSVATPAANADWPPAALATHGLGNRTPTRYVGRPCRG